MDYVPRIGELVTIGKLWERVICVNTKIHNICEPHYINTNVILDCIVLNPSPFKDYNIVLEFLNMYQDNITKGK